MSFQIVYEASDRLIIGEGPFEPDADFGPDYPIATVGNDAQHQVLLNTNPAYLSLDGQYILGAPP